MEGIPSECRIHTLKKKNNPMVYDEIRNTWVTFTIPNAFNESNINKSDGKFRCYNCTQHIYGRVYFCPKDVDNKQCYTLNSIPHCSASCALRTVIDTKSNDDQVMLFYLYYGEHVQCAPPRSLLFIPNGFDIETYHANTSYKIQAEKHNVQFIPLRFVKNENNNDKVDETIKSTQPTQHASELFQQHQAKRPRL